MREIDLRGLAGSQTGAVARGEGKFPRLARFADGTLFVATHRGTHQFGVENALYGFSSSDGGHRWDGPFAMHDEPGIDPRSLAVGVGPDDVLYAGWHENRGAQRDDSRVAFHRSLDGGRAWERIGVLDLGDPDRFGHWQPFGKLLFEEDGAILMHCYVYPRRQPAETTEGQDAHLYESRDGGATWSLRAVIAKAANESSIIRRSDGSLLAVSRTAESPPHLIALTSDDGGRTWACQGAVSGDWEIPGECVQLQAGPLLCFFGRRHPPFGVRARVSDDEGRSWRDDVELVIDDSWPTRDCGYPTVELAPGGPLVIAWYVNNDDPVDVRAERQCRWLLVDPAALVAAMHAR